jgi:hypothetical protein
MTNQDWTPSKVMQVHLQSLVSKVFMMVIELTTCRLPEDPMTPVLAEGCMVAFVVFYGQGFGVASHQFVHSMLQHNSLCQGEPATADL